MINSSGYRHLYVSWSGIHPLLEARDMAETSFQIFLAKKAWPCSRNLKSLYYISPIGAFQRFYPYPYLPQKPLALSDLLGDRANCTMPKTTVISSLSWEWSWGWGWWTYWTYYEMCLAKIPLITWVPCVPF